MEIRKVCYKLYKTDWESTVSLDQKLEAIREWGTDGKGVSFEEFLNEYGYDGALYVCFDEFLLCEYLEKDYMLTLLSENQELREQYLRDVAYIQEKTFHIENIQWDTDGIPTILPVNVDIRKTDLLSGDEKITDVSREELLDRAADYLTDTYGFCIKSFENE